MPFLFLKCLFSWKMPFFSESALFSRKVSFLAKKMLNYAFLCTLPFFLNKSSPFLPPSPKKCLFSFCYAFCFVENALFLGKCPFISKIKLKSAPFKRSMPSFSSFLLFSLLSLFFFLFLLFLKRAFYASSKKGGLSPPPPVAAPGHG